MPIKYDPRVRLSGSLLGSLVAQWGRRSLYATNEVQRGTIAVSSGVSATATIAVVDPNNARLRLVGFGSNFNETNNKIAAKIAFTNGTTITASVNTAPVSNISTCSYEVAAFVPGVIRAVQRGTATGSGTVNATLTTVQALSRTEVDYLGTTGVDTNTNLTSIFRLSLTTVTNIAGNTIGSSDTFSYQSTEYF